MKKIAALGLAAAIGLTGALAATGADAKDWNNKWDKWPHQNYQHHNYHPRSGFYMSSPFFFGFSFGPQYRTLQRPYYASGNLHVQWCASRYKTYNPYSNTFFIKKGVPAVCVSPYSNPW